MKNEAFIPPKWDDFDAGALKALARGDADAGQQQRALKWIIESAAGTYDLSFRPDPHQTAFAEGRRFVGLQVVKLLKIDLPALKERKHG